MRIVHPQIKERKYRDMKKLLSCALCLALLLSLAGSALAWDEIHIPATVGELDGVPDFPEIPTIKTKINGQQLHIQFSEPVSELVINHYAGGERQIPVTLDANNEATVDLDRVKTQFGCHTWHSVKTLQGDPVWYGWFNYEDLGPYRTDGYVIRDEVIPSQKVDGETVYLTTNQDLIYGVGILNEQWGCDVTRQDGSYVGWFKWDEIKPNYTSDEYVIKFPAEGVVMELYHANSKETVTAHSIEELIVSVTDQEWGGASVDIIETGIQEQFGVWGNDAFTFRTKDNAQVNATRDGRPGYVGTWVNGSSFFMSGATGSWVDYNRLVQSNGAIKCYVNSINEQFNGGDIAQIRTVYNSRGNLQKYTITYRTSDTETYEITYNPADKPIYGYYKQVDESGNTVRESGTGGYGKWLNFRNELTPITDALFASPRV